MSSEKTPVITRDLLRKQGTGLSDHTTGLINTSGNAHCPHCGVCHTADESCIQALQRVLALYEKRQPPPSTGNGCAEPGDRLRAVGEYVANLKANLRPKEKCPHCFGSNDPGDQTDCVSLPCMIGRDFPRPALEKVIQQLEALLVPSEAGGVEAS